MAKVIITGANRGIGLELAKQLHERGDEVIAAVRKSSEGLSALGVRVEEGVDVTDQASVDAFAAKMAGEAVDVLINNAGLLEMDNLDAPNFDTIRRQLEINAIGPLRVTSALLGTLSEGSKVAHITSRMGSIGDNTSGGMYGYRMSKAALNIAGVSMARDLEEKGIAVGLLHPGMVATDMTSRFGTGDGWQKPADAAALLIQRIDELSLELTGTFRHASGDVLPW